MAFIEVVIKIPEGDYKFIKETAEKEPSNLNYIARKILTGTPLPKGHGRLKDVDYGLKNCKDEHEIEYWDKEVPTIIEADKESEE